MTRSVRSTLVLGLSVSALALSATGQPVDPRGVFFHSYQGAGFAGLEWVTLVEDPGDRRYEFSDIRGLVPFSGTIGPAGSITWDAGPVSGSGSFSDENTASFAATFGSAPFTSDLWRAPRTTPGFLTELVSPQAGAAALSGEFRVTIEDLHPQSGAVLGVREEIMTLDVLGTTLRLTESNGDYVQGVFESDDAVGFRVVEPAAQRSRYASFAGSETNRLLNLMGDLRFDGFDSFSATMLLQTRVAPGAQTQFVEHYSAVRIPAPASLVPLALVVSAVARRRRDA